MAGRLAQAQQFNRGIAADNCNTVAVTVSRRDLLSERRRRPTDGCLTGVLPAGQRTEMPVNRAQQLAADSIIGEWQAATAECIQDDFDSSQQDVLFTRGRINNED